MALVTYSDSENSDSETDSKTQATKGKQAPPAPPAKSSKAAATSEFQPLVDRRNPRKIRVNLPDIKPEDGEKDVDDGGEPARKKARVGAGGQFSGFNSLLPAPKRKIQSGATSAVKDGNDKKGALAPKVFSLKTGATPGFDRSADAEMRQEYAHNGIADDNGTSRESPSMQGDNTGAHLSAEPKTEEPAKKKSAMMFKPLSVARGTTKKKPRTESNAHTSDKAQQINKSTEHETQYSEAQQPEPMAKPKVSLFGFSKEEKPALSSTASFTTHGSYEPLVYSTGVPSAAAPPDGLQPDAPTSETQPSAQHHPATATANEPTLTSIANDLNLSRAEKRQLFGRNAPPSFAESSTEPSASAPRILTFNTDAEYASNQALLSSTSEADRAALQHNPVRAIAPGKHSLQQLVNVASNQRDALEESFASGRRNKKEAGSRYGW